MTKRILKMLNKNARASLEEMAAATGRTTAEVATEIGRLEDEGIIRGYKTVIDWGKTEKPYVSAIIQLKATPKTGRGFEEIAERITLFPEVESVYLMSGVYDLNVVVKCRTFEDVAMFVAKELSPLDSVTSTATHFVLRRYKELDVPLGVKDPDERGVVS